VPFVPPVSLVNGLSLRAFNEAYFRANSLKAGYAVALPDGRTVDIRAAGAGVDALRPQPGQPLLLMLGQGLAHGEARQHVFVAAQPRIPGRKLARIERDVGVAEQGRFVAGRARRKRDVAMARIERRAVAADAVVHLVEAGVEAGAGRRAGCCPAIVTAEEHALGRERVRIWRPHDRMAGRRQAIAAPLVAGDDENIRAAKLLVQDRLLVRRPDGTEIIRVASQCR